MSCSLPLSTLWITQYKMEAPVEMGLSKMAKNAMMATLLWRIAV